MRSLVWLLAALLAAGCAPAGEGDQAPPPSPPRTGAPSTGPRPSPPHSGTPTTAPGPSRSRDYFEEVGILELLWGLRAMEAGPLAVTPEQRRRMLAHLETVQEGLDLIAWSELQEPDLDEPQARFVESWVGTPSDSAEVTLRHALEALEPLAGRPPRLLRAPSAGWEARGVEDSPTGYEAAAAATALARTEDPALRLRPEQAAQVLDTVYTMLEGDRLERRGLRAMASLLTARQKDWIRERRGQWRDEYTQLKEFDDLNSRENFDVHLARMLLETYQGKEPER